MKSTPFGLIQWGTSGGGPKFLRDLATTWEQMYPGEVCITYNRDAVISNDLRSIGVPSLPIQTYNRSTASILANSPRIPLLARNLRQFIAAQQVTTLISPMASIYQWLVVPMAIPKNVKYIDGIHDATRHPGELHRGLDLLSSLTRKRADHILTFSETVRDELIHSGKAPEGKVTASFHPAWRPISGMNYNHKSLDLTRPIVVGFFGRLLEYKGLSLLLESIRILIARGVNVEISVVGDGPERRLKEHAVDIPGNWRIARIPEEEIESTIRSFDILALPYTESSQSGVLAEALALGVPVVATPVGGLVQQIGDSASGLVAKEVTAVAVADSIQELIENPELYAKLSDAGIQAATEVLGWGRLVTDIRSIALSLQ